MITFDFELLRGIGLSETLAQRARDAADAERGDAGDADIDTNDTDTDDACANVSCADHAGDAALALMRVIAVHRTALQLHDGRTVRAARILPRLLRDAAGAGALAVGDWVLVGIDAAADLWVRARVEPTSHIARRDGDGSRHPIVSNVDRALVVMGLDDDFNLRRLERYLSLVLASGVEPLVVLSKADIAAADPARRDARIAQLRDRLAPGLEVVAVDATDPASAASFAAVTGFGQTLVVLGSSGAGKSSLTNTLLGASVQDTGAVRVHDGRGMHTTTARSLHRLPGGACIIDTPGLRTLRPDADAEALRASFADVATLSSRCRFRDCAHAGEPGCAVRAGVDPDRLDNFQKMLRENRRDTLTWIERRQQLSAWKSRGREARVRVKMKRGEG
ncbi:MAG TPA: ribosome small subunit-dependent GTPase A [Caldimonas sp.]|jgi:ribosome biogenesis GTPase|nr:ribosome small subunit-dependent GTPase A [Caldimonas sp.]HEV7576156.1 ribosome small subunit-dependent GTPase A [Caldimonas sp.]